MKDLRVQVGSQKVSRGSVVLTLEVAGGAESASNQATTPTPKRKQLSKQNRLPLRRGAAPAPARWCDGGARARHRRLQDVAVIELLVKAGDTVKLGNRCSPSGPTRRRWRFHRPRPVFSGSSKVKVGDTVNIGDLVALMETSAGSAPAPLHRLQRRLRHQHRQPPCLLRHQWRPLLRCPRSPARLLRACRTPALGAQICARALGVPLDEVQGAQAPGASPDDVQNFTKAVMTGAAQTRASAAKAPAISGGGSGEGPEPAALAQGGLHPSSAPWSLGPRASRRSSGASLHRNWVVIPHVTNPTTRTSPTSKPSALQFNKENRRVASRSPCSPS